VAYAAPVAGWQVGGIEVLRVDDPGFELVLPQDEPTTSALAASPWLRPHFVTDDLALVIGSSATVVRTRDAVVLVDPFLAFDDGADHGRRLGALREAGVEADDVDVVVNSHVDDLGVNLLLDGSPTFPNARYLVPGAELDALRSGEHPQAELHERLLDLHRDGTIEASAAGETVAPGVRLEDAPGHNPGHHVVWVEDGHERAVIAGHLFLHPAQIASPEATAGDLDPALLARTRRDLLARCAAEDVLLVGPLFAPPGAGRVVAEGGGWRLAAV
jgi:glyoxylase-like metal-dependent hydrolase (beta-lactamase superfamily II)